MEELSLAAIVRVRRVEQIALLIVHVPAECLEEGVEEFAAELGFVLLGRVVGVAVLLEPLDEIQDLRWWLRHLDGECLLAG